MSTEAIANRAAFWLAAVALSVSAVTLFLWLFFTQEGLAFGIGRAVTVLVIFARMPLALRHRSSSQSQPRLPLPTAC